MKDLVEYDSVVNQFFLPMIKQKIERMFLEKKQKQIIVELPHFQIVLYKMHLT
ncbi:MAG: hypothetical protein MR439_04345 [Clostridium sp.]|nr:hypothetical protein [Clostridium sp.]